MKLPTSLLVDVKFIEIRGCHIEPEIPAIWSKLRYIRINEPKVEPNK